MTRAAGGYVVVDASVALKWALDDEEEVDCAIALRDDGIRGRFQMLAPSLWLYEVVNGLVVAVARERLPKAVAARALGHLLEVGVRLVDPEAEECFKQATRLGLSGYDAAYLALAEAVKGEAWTGDRRLYERARRRAARVRWIGDYGS